MRARFFLISLISLISLSTVYSQDATVTDDELTRYATAMDSINEMSANVMILITDMVNGNETVNAARYNELSKIIGDETRLNEAKATAEEIAFVKEVAAKKAEETVKINKAFQSLAKEYVGAATYNKVKKALAADAALKGKYDALMAELAKDNPGAD